MHGPVRIRLSYMFQRLLYHLQGEFKICNQTMYKQFWAYDKVLPEDGVTVAEACTTALIIIHVFYCIHAFCWCIKDIVTMELLQHRRVKVFSYSCLSLSTDRTIHTPSLHHSYLILRADKYIIICCKYLLLSPDNQQHKGTSSDKHYRFYLTSICR